MIIKCPVCDSDEFYDLLYTLNVCCKCRALLEDIPLYKSFQVILSDASKRYPEILTMEWNEEFINFLKFLRQNRIISIKKRINHV